jgi:hypothetical protein
MLTGLKTYLGIALAVLGGLAGQLDVVPAQNLPEWATVATTVIGGIIAVLGRLDKERRAPDPK